MIGSDPQDRFFVVSMPETHSGIRRPGLSASGIHYDKI